MLKVSVLVLVMLLSTLLLAKEEKSIVYENYDKAMKGEEYLRFDMESTKAGLLTTGFTSVVKKFSVAYDRAEDLISGGEVHFKVDEMDTDVGARNEKMKEVCLGMDKHPEIKVIFLGQIPLGSSEQKAKMIIRGKEKEITVKVNVEKVGNAYKLEGSSKVTLSGLEIPDPSIWIAKVRDLVDITFSVLIN